MAWSVKRTLFPIILFVLFCTVLLLLTFYLLAWPWLQANTFSLVFLTVITIVLHVWQERSFHSDPKGSVRRFMTGLVFKMFACLAAVVGIMLSSDGPERVRSILVFIFLYLGFLAFSTARLSVLGKRK